MKERIGIAGCFVIAGMALGMLLTAGFHICKPQKAEQGLPSPAPIQRQLNILEPENLLKVDGKISRLTIEKWDRVYIRESAKATFAEFEKGE